MGPGNSASGEGYLGRFNLDQLHVLIYPGEASAPSRRRHHHTAVTARPATSPHYASSARHRAEPDTL